MSLLLPRRRCRGQLTWQWHQFGYRMGADAVADLLQPDPIAEYLRDMAQPGDGAGEVGATAALHRLQQRVGVHGKRVCTDAVERLGDLGDDGLAQL